MNITVIYGQQHRGNTWRLTKLFLDQFEGAAITEFFLPQSGPLYCTGCMRCINKGETYCPHAETVQPIVEAIDQSDLIVFASPCYVMNMTGQMKSLMEHLAYPLCPIGRNHPCSVNKDSYYPQQLEREPAKQQKP